MSNFIVSALKYRPVRFDDVVGQEHVGRTLKNALKNEQLAHAFLFCGPRGVGKTTCARILAKVLNCQNVTSEYEPCNECPSCQAFNRNASFNITELDAASNNSVEHIRTLIEQVRFQPQQGRYKIFIIDEVHMLSQQAFNAFLKTLEEPPPYALFILATTEKHKIIPTILSRCQIFDFKRIQIPAMVKHMQEICKEESIKAEKDALHIIAQKADGALRDALSIFDRIVAFAGKDIQYDDVISNLNILDYDYYFRLVDALLVEDAAQIMLLFDEIQRNGFDGDLFINGLAGHLRNLLVCKDPQTLELLEVSEGLKDRYLKQAILTPTAFILTALNIANDCDINYKMARNKRLHVEMALIKMTYIQRAVKVRPLTPDEGPEKKKQADPVGDVESAGGAEIPEVAHSDIQRATEDTTAAGLHSPAPEGDSQLMVKDTGFAEGNDINDQNAAEDLTKTKVLSPDQHATKDTAAANLPSSKTKKSTPSLAGGLDALVAQVKKDEGITEGGEEPEELSLEAVRAVWKEYVDKHEQESVKAFLNKTELQIHQKNILAKVGSPLAENTIRQENGLMDFLREKLQSQQLTLSVQVDENKRSTAPRRKKILGPKDKYRKMLAANPHLKELQKRFQLRPDE